MTAFATLRALGWQAPVPVPTPLTVRDMLGRALMHHLEERRAWRFGAGMTVDEDGDQRVTVRVFLPEFSQSDRDLGRKEAGEMRGALVEALRLEGFVVRFADHLWSEAGQRGWVVLAKGMGLP